MWYIQNYFFSCNFAGCWTAFASYVMLEPDRWLERHGDYLYSIARLKVGSREAAEDLVQETFISAIRAKDAFRNQSSERTWLVAILNNKIIDHYRKKDVLKNTTVYLAETDDDFAKPFFENTSGHWLKTAALELWAAPADATMNDVEFDKVLLECVQKMPSKLIPVFMAKFLDDDDAETICKVHNISSSNYWVILHRSKVLIRSCLEKNWFSL
jgi:RNA polymerase sigma-70 factor (TIGR02943 family)